MTQYKKYFKMIIRKAISGRLRFIIFYLIGLNNYISLIIKAIDHRGNTRASKNILCIERSMFEKDVDELSRHIRKYGWIWMTKNQITTYQTLILPKNHQIQTEYYRRISEDPKKWEECIRRSKILISRLKKEKKVCAILLANIDYWQDYSLRVACKELGMPVFVLQKEYAYNRDLVETELAYWRKHNFKTNADVIMVFGKFMKEGYLRENNFKENNIYITGAPRNDVWCNIEHNNQSTAEGIVILSFNSGTKISREKFLNFLKGLIEYLKNKNDEKITIKSRDPDDHQTIVNFCNKEGIKNVEVIQYVNLFDLVSQSKLVIASRSLSTVESMMTKKNILVPDWIIDGEKDKMFDSKNSISSKVVKICANEQELYNNIDDIIKNNKFEIDKNSIDARKKFLNYFWDYEENVLSSTKVQKVLDAYIK
jgi:TusA-related sulfurtransferase